MLCHHPTFDKAYFKKPSGEFIREVSDSEAEFLCQNCLEIECSVEHPKFLPTWYFIKSVRVLDDYFSWKPGTSDNGGDYSFHTFRDWYVAKYPNGEWKFAYVERHSSSAEFSFDELAGRFQPNLETLTLLNTEEQSFYWAQSPSVIEEILEKIAFFASFSDLWNEEYEYIPPYWEKEEGFVKNALSFSDKKEVITRLKEVGVTKQDSKPSLRRQRRGGRR